jgi:hypothetical protein
MGCAISWLAMRGSMESAVLTALGLEKTGETEEIPNTRWSTTHIGEWILIWSPSFGTGRFRKAASKLKSEAVICDLEEHVMFSAASGYSSGTLTWRIVHEAQQGLDHLAVEGRPPDSLARIEALARTEAEEFARARPDHKVDVAFDVPVRVAQEIVGFRYDQETGTVWKVLRKTKPWWRFW